MKIQIQQQWTKDASSDWGVVFVQTNGEIVVPESTPPEVKAVIARMHEGGDLPKKIGELRRLYDLNVAGLKRGLLVSIGSQPASALSPEDWQKAFQTAARALCDKPGVNVAWFLPDGLEGAATAAAPLVLAATALTMAPQSQGLYQQEPKRFPYATVTLVTQAAAAERAVEVGQIIGRATNLTRELINRGPHELTPASFADRAGQVAAATGLTCRIFDEGELQAERMNSMLSVARGSDQPPRMVVLEHRGAGDAPFVALVGKGVTYDSGGLSLKPSDSMKTMKSDMSGAATVLGAMQAIAERNLPVNVRGYMGLVENMISGSAYRLGDILTARNGVTIEVMNTDAEGRLVLADVLCYAVDEGCDRIVDLATLTGSCVVALGEDYAGVFTNSADWCAEVLAATHRAGEKAWEMPMCDSFAEQLRSDVADCKNIGGRWGGAITAAKFLEKFVAGKPWVHLDIAGPAFLPDGKSYREGGATGAMLRSLLCLLEAR